MRMTQNFIITWRSIRQSLFFLLLFMPELLAAQENKDHLRIPDMNIRIHPEGTLWQYSVPSLFPDAKSKFQKYTISAFPKTLSAQPDFSQDLSRKGELRLPYAVNPSLLFKGDFRTSGVVQQFAHGYLFGSGQQTSVPGIGRFNNASLGYQHIFNDKFELQVRANAMKINMMHATGQAFSTSGSLLYHASDRVAFKVFGSYDIGNSYGMSTHSYGASMSVDVSERFNLEMGVERYYDSMRGRWVTVPVVIPSYRFNNFTLGLDVGGIIYEILRSTIFDKRDSGGGPTIGPPRMSIPIRSR